MTRDRFRVLLLSALRQARAIFNLRNQCTAPERVLLLGTHLYRGDDSAMTPEEFVEMHWASGKVPSSIRLDPRIITDSGALLVDFVVSHDLVEHEGATKYSHIGQGPFTIRRG